MEKIEINFPIEEVSKFYFNGKEVHVLKNIPLQNKIAMSQWYLDAILQEDIEASKIVEAEMSIVLGIVDSCTNILVNEDSYIIDIDQLINSGLWKNIREKIDNYNEFRDELERISKIAQDSYYYKKSMSKTFDKISKKIEELIDNVSQVDFSQEGISNLLKNFNEVTSKFEEKYAVNPIETTPAKKTKKKTTSE